MTQKSQRRLTAKQARFVQEYLIDGNATGAARRAGYKDGNKGRQLVTVGNVTVAIKQAQAKLAAKLEITQEAVLKNIIRIGDKAEDAEKYADALKAQEMLAKRVKLYEDDDKENQRTLPNVIYNFIQVNECKT